MTADQVDSFKREGYLILRDFFDPSLIALWREQFWAHLGGGLEDRTSWPESSAIEGLALTPTLGELPALRAVVDQLGRGQFNDLGCGVIVRWPKEGQPWQMPKSGHVDGYPGEGCQAVLMMGATCYLYDVEPRGGTLVYLPRSHRSAHRYFLRFPDRIEGTFRETPEWEKRGWDIFVDSESKPPQEFTGRARDVMLWHGWLTHTSSDNARPTPRIGLFDRWSHVDDAGVRKHVPENLWHHWAI